MTPEIDADAVAWIDTDQMREIDRVMVDELGIALIQMMENAGRNLARLILDERSVRSAAVYVGPGGNGGGGLVAARHLANAGVDVTVVTGPTNRMSATSSLQLDIVRHMGLDVRLEPVVADVAVDALVGYSLQGDLRGWAAELAPLMRESSELVVSLDVPSGIDATTGEAGAIVVRPDVTVTLCLPKTGLADPDAVGRLYLADISVPSALTERIGGRPAPPFRLGTVLRLQP